MKVKLFGICCLLIFFASFTQVVSAEPSDWPITSPFGWREHPIFHTQRFHDGVDFGLDAGTPIPVAASGVVTFAGWNGGYGNAVIVQHSDGTRTLYAHQSSIAVSSGQNVTKNQIIGYVGSTGWSTGPHLHLSYFVNDSSANPIPFLIAQGWNITNGGNGGIADDLTGYEGFNEAAWNFENYYNLGKMISETMLIFVNACKEGMKLLQEEALVLLSIFAVLDLTLYIYLSWWELSWTAIISRIMKYGFIIYLVTNWQGIVNDVVKSFFVDNATAFTTEGTVIAKNMSTPELITQKGVYLMQPAFSYVASFHGLNFLASFFSCMLALVIGLLLLTIFIAMSLLIMLYYLEFYIFAMFSVLSIVFSILFPTKFVAEGGIGALISSGMKLMIVGVLISMVVKIITPLKPEAYELTAYLHILCACFGFAYIIAKLPKTLADILGGNVKF